MKKQLIILVLVLVASFSFAQNAYRDSLKIVYKNHTLSDSVRLSALRELANFPDNLDTAWYYIGLLKNEANKKKEPLWLARVKWAEGHAYKIEEKYTEAIRSFRQAIPLYRQSPKKYASYECLANIYGLFNKMKVTDSAAFYYHSLDSIYQSLPENAYKDKYYLCQRVALNVPDGENELNLQWRLEGLKSLEHFGSERELMSANAHIAFLMKQLGYDERFNYRLEALRIAKKLKDKRAIIDQNNRLSRYNQEVGKLEKALKYLQESALIVDSLNDAALKCRVYRELGDFYCYCVDNYKVAAKYTLKARELAMKENFISEIIGTNFLMAELFEASGDYDKALQYLLDCESIIQANKYNLHHLPVQYSNISQIYLLVNKPIQAKEYLAKLEEAINIWKDKNNYALLHITRARILVYSGNYAEAALDFKKAEELYNEIKWKDYRVGILVELGETYLKQNAFNQAIIYCKQGLKLAEELKSLRSQKRSCDCLSKAYEGNNQPTEALYFVRKEAEIQDSIQTNSAQAALQNYAFETQRRTDSTATFEKERQVELAHQEEVRQEKQSRNLAYGGVGLALLLAGGFYSRWRFVNRSKKIIEKEKERSESLLLNILPEEVAKELKQKGRSEARDFDEVSILFTDFESFTKTSEKLNPKELVEEINTCFEYFDGLVGINGIEKIKTIGDAYMAVGGLPKPLSDSAKRVVKAALEMQRFMINRYKDHTAKGLPAFRMRVGIHTGPVVAGIVGVKKFQYDIWGDTVNTASRMESAGKVGKVNISQSTYELLKDDADFVFETRGMIEAKGKGELEMYFVSFKR